MQEENIKGFFLIDKPEGVTSFDVIKHLRKITGYKKIGHSGTLDPMATGLLVVAISKEYTKRLKEFEGLDKTYLAKIKLGENTDTYDREGSVIERFNTKASQEDVKKALREFSGQIKQVPPIYSAKKILGKSAHYLARAGADIEMKAVLVNILSIELFSFDFPIINLRVKVSAGTYIRSLAFDIGNELQTGGYLYELRREHIGKLSVKRAIDLADIKKADDLLKYRFDI